VLDGTVKEAWPRAILFDLDNTIIAYSDGAEACWMELCEEYAPRAESLTADRLFSAITTAKSWYWSDRERFRLGRLDLRRARSEIVALAFENLGIRNNLHLARDIADIFTTRREKSVKPFPRAIDALHRIRAKTDRLALITNGAGNVQRDKIVKYDLGRFFDVILIEGEFGAGKPQAEVYQHVLCQLDVTPEKTWMVGDNMEFDVAAPQELGIKGIWVDYAGTGLPEAPSTHPYRIIRHIEDLLS
jgi:putative hydrolase of the HAD superfamily